MKNILIIGSSGKLGSSITKELLGQGHNCLLTHNHNLYFQNSKKFDLFKDKIEQILLNPDHKRIFLTKGQYNKLIK